MSRPHHEHLRVWREAMRLVRQIYTVTGRFPASEKAGLVAQMRRAAIAIPAGIAEASGTGDPAKFADALHAAGGAVRELETFEVLARQLRMTGGLRAWLLRRRLRRYTELLDAEAESLDQTLEHKRTVERAAPRLRFRRAA